MTPVNRIRNLSTRWLTVFKIVVLVVYACLCAVISYSFLFRAGSFNFPGLISVALYVWIFYLLMRMIVKLERVEFDENFLYVLRKEQDLVIPLEHIESVEIATAGGLYKVNLYHTSQAGKFFYFKQSLWYPLNYKRCDALVNVLRKNIAAAKQKMPVQGHNALHS